MLVNARVDAVDALEDSAKARDLETAKRSIKALSAILQNKKAEAVAVAALKRLSSDRSTLIAAQAAEIVRKFEMTDEDIAVAALEKDGVRILRMPNGMVASITVVNDVQLAQLKHISQLRSISLRVKQITNAGVNHLAAIKDLTRLRISQTSLTGVWLGKFKSLPKLSSISINADEFTADGLAQLQPLKSLKHLSLKSIPDEKRFRALAKLRHLDALSVTTSNPPLPSIALLDLFGRLQWFSICLAHRDSGHPH